MDKVKETEKVLRAAFEVALEEGFYPLDGTYGTNQGGCCALGMLGVVQNFYDPDTLGKGGTPQRDNKAYAEVLGITAHEVGGIVAGFDGSDPEDDDFDADQVPFVALGRKLREDYFLCDGKRPEEI